MKHIKYFHEFINEAVSDIESIYQKYYSDIDRGVYDKIVEADPTTVMKDNKQGVYVKWMIKLYKNKKLKLEDLYKATEYLDVFNMFKHKMVNKDIMFYQSLPELFKAVEAFLEKEETKFSNDEERKLAGQFKVVYTDDEYRIIIPFTLNASKYFGRDTEWCTLNTDMFKKYTKKQTEDITPFNLYILYTENPKDRLQFHFKEKEFMDIENDEINQEEFFDEHKNIYNFFNKYFKIDRYIKDLSITWSRNTLEGAPKTVEGDFNCYDNQLTSLEGAPDVVDGDFNCTKNQITSLKGAPQTLGGGFYCSSNKLTSLEGAPKTVEGGFYCSDNQLTGLVGSPLTIEGDFDCNYNKLTSLVGVPETVEGGFDCNDNQLTSLVGAPQTVKGVFRCYNNQLTSLEGAPKTVEGGFHCYHNQLTSLEGAPKTVEGNFYCSKNPNLPKEEIEKYHKTGAVKGRIFSDHGTYEPIN
jgi:hypothetical protein